MSVLQPETLHSESQGRISAPSLHFCVCLSCHFCVLSLQETVESQLRKFLQAVPPLPPPYTCKENKRRKCEHLSEMSAQIEDPVAFLEFVTKPSTTTNTHVDNVHALGAPPCTRCFGNKGNLSLSCTKHQLMTFSFTFTSQRKLL